MSGERHDEPADVYMVKRAYTSERLFREVWEPQGWKRESLPLGPRLPRCRDVFPGHRKPPPGPASLPRTCALPLDHEGQHGRDGINW